MNVFFHSPLAPYLVDYLERKRKKKKKKKKRE
jgi:hypothetical protein